MSQGFAVSHNTTPLKKRRFQFCTYLWLMALCVMATGCFPYHYTTRIGFSGRVVDAENNKPLAKAQISMTAGGRANEIIVAFTRLDGSFNVPPQKKWGIWIIPQDYLGWQHAGGTACVRYAEYETNCIAFSSVDSRRRFVPHANLGIIALKPVSKTY